MAEKGICFLIILTTNLFSLSGNSGMRGVSISFVGKDKINSLTKKIKLNYQRNQNMKSHTDADPSKGDVEWALRSLLKSLFKLITILRKCTLVLTIWIQRHTT